MRAGYGESDGKWREPWGTALEKQFIEHLGCGTWTPKSKSGSDDKRRRRLEGYIRAAESRTDWGEVDGAEAIAYARHLLAELELVRRVA